MNPDLSYESSITDESKLVIELFKNCEEGQALNLKKDLENCFSSPKLDTATRRCIKKATTNRRTYSECVNLLLVCVDVNYRNLNFDNSTLFMFACSEGNYFIIEQISNFDFSQNSFKPDQKLNLNLKDNNQRSFLHYLLTSQIQEDDAYEIISRFVSDSDYKTRYINQEENIYYTNSNLNFSATKKFNFEINVKEVFNNADVLGNTPLSITLSKGWYKLSKYILMIAEERYLNKVDLNNYIHCAVFGKSLNCLNLILKESSLDDVRQKNKDSFNPSELAKKLEMYYFSKIIDNFEEHCHNSNYFNIFSDKAIIFPDKIFEKFIQEDYNETLFLLGQLSTLKSIKEQPNLSLEWNVILTKFYLNLEKESSESSRKDSFKISPESILTKFLDTKDRNYNRKNEKKNFLQIMSDFFNLINVKNTPANNYNNNDVFDLLMLNKGIYYFKIGDDNQTIRIFWDYYKHYLDYKDCKYYKWIVYVNTTFIIIEIFIKKKFFSLVGMAIKKLEEFLFTRNHDKKDYPIDQHILLTTGYLDSKEIINNYTDTWDESFCLLNLYKAMKNLDLFNIQETKICFKEYKKLYDKCSYKGINQIFDSLRNFYISLKIKTFYLEDNKDKFFRNLNKIHQLTKIENINLTINDKKINRNYRVDPYILFYLNSMGIMYLKQKRYTSAEYFFKLCIEHFKKIWATISKLQFDYSIKLTDIYLIKYNLGLCYFFQKKYDKAYKIFKEIINKKNIINHVFVWYRIGLCLLEIELNELRKLREKNTVSEFISKTYGYDASANPNNLNNLSKNCIKNSSANSNKNKKLKSSNLNSSNPSNSHSIKNNNSPSKTNKEKDESWDAIKYLNENLKDTIGITNLDEKAESVVNHINQMNEDLEFNQHVNINRRRIILQNNILSEINYENLYDNSRTKFENNEDLNNSQSNNENEENNEYNSDYNEEDYNHNVINLNRILKLSECIYCFKKVISFFKIKDNFSKEFINLNIESEELIGFFNNKDREKENKRSNNYTNAAGDLIQETNKNELIMDQKKNILPKSFNSLMNNTYLTLIFTLILDKNWVGALAVCQEYERIDYLKKDKDIKIKLNNFIVEIYINLNQTERALEIIRIDLKNNNNLLNEKTNFYSSSHNNLHNEIQFKMMLYNNMMKMHLVNNNIQEAESCLTNILEAFNIQSIYDVPSFITNTIIYLNLIKGNNQIVLNLLKFKRINTNNMNLIPNAPLKSEKTKKT